MTEATQLKRSISLPMIIFFGLGNILGAGIYVLIGKVAGHAGMFVPVSFIIASSLAVLTAFSYAELSSRYPLSAGAAIYIYKGFKLPSFALITGLIIIMTGIVSAATISRGFVGYVQVFVDFPGALLITLLLISLGLLAAWGIKESIRTVAVITILEIMGLLIIVFVAGDSLFELPQRYSELIPPLSPGAFEGIYAASFIAFYAYIGFEDMVNVAEETEHAERNMPYAIVICLGLATFIYILIALISVLSMSPEILAESEAPLALIYEHSSGRKPVLISLISIIAVVNGALIQIIMASRVCYGLSKQGWIPEILGRINARTKTPVIATVVVTIITLILALWLPIETLAKTTSFFLLVIFTFVNLALVKIKLNKNEAPAVFTTPLWIPVCGALACAFFCFYQISGLLS
ncbi:MAG: amino acid permease [Gammaproteobacteria bacterium]|nr:amino acid permease [Gammaproteobacteria bacterium]